MAETVYKAKKPFKQDGKYYYPITSHDQIIMPDGNRWDGQHLSSDIRDEATEVGSIKVNADLLGGVAAANYALKSDLDYVGLTSDSREGETGQEIESVPVNADQLGGVEASLYALKTDTVANSNQLGGRAPEYYVQPRNLLDNSDFRNPVNQRDVTSWFASIGIDRWYAWPSANDYTANITESGIMGTINGGAGTTAITLQQRMPKGTINPSKVYTIAACYADGEIRTGHMINDPDDTDKVRPYIDISNGDFDFVNTFIKNGETLAWAALYEGEYTADNLPPYVPKGYGVELAECQRYYCTYGNLRLLLLHNADGVDRGTFLFPTKMRIIPTLSYEITGDPDAQFTLEETTKQGFSCYANGVKGCVQIVNCIANADL